MDHKILTQNKAWAVHKILMLKAKIISSIKIIISMVLAEIIKIMGIISRITIIIVKTLILKTIIKTITNSPNILILTMKILKRILQRKNPLLLQATKIHWNNIMIKRSQDNIINNSRSRKLIYMYVRNNLTKKVTLDPNRPINILN